jgi:carbon storage regulator
MLVLSRKKNESIVINNDVTVTVIDIRGDRVRLGVVAPKQVPVHRQEVHDAIHGIHYPLIPVPERRALIFSEPAFWGSTAADAQILLEVLEATGVTWAKTTSVAELQQRVRDVLA